MPFTFPRLAVGARGGMAMEGALLSKDQPPSPLMPLPIDPTLIRANKFGMITATGYIALCGRFIYTTVV